MPNHELNDTHIGSISIFLQSKDSAKNFRPGENSQCQWELENIVSPPPDTIMMIGLTSAEIPYTFYNVPSTQNFIKIANQSNQLTINVPPGNYNVFSLRDVINAQLAANSILGATCVFDEVTNKYTFKNLTIGGTINIMDTTMSTLFGLGPNQTGVAMQSITAENVCNLAGTSSVYVSLNNLSFTNLDSRGDLNGVVAKLPVTVAPGEYIFYQQTENQYYILHDAEIQNFNVALTDDNNEPINLNGAQFSVTLTLHFSKKRTAEYDDRFFVDKPDFAYRNQEEKKIDPYDPEVYITQGDQSEFITNFEQKTLNEIS